MSTKTIDKKSNFIFIVFIVAFFSNNCNFYAFGFDSKERNSGNSEAQKGIIDTLNPKQQNIKNHKRLDKSNKPIDGFFHSADEHFILNKTENHSLAPWNIEATAEDQGNIDSAAGDPWDPSKKDKPKD